MEDGKISEYNDNQSPYGVATQKNIFTAVRTSNITPIKGLQLTPETSFVTLYSSRQRTMPNITAI
jgi:hypothetical protein